MKALRKLRLLAWLLSVWVSVYPIRGVADDIDIFVGSSAGLGANPNVLIVLDNTSNWSRQSQQWPGGEQQGQSEASALNTVIQGLSANVNVGLMEFVTGSSATYNGGFIRSAILPMNATNKSAFSDRLTTIYNDITGPSEKRNSNTPYGNLMWDVYNYYAGANQSQGGGGTLGSPYADSNGYASQYGTFASPINCGTSCARNFIIFISNPNATGPAADSAENTAALAALGGNTTQLGLPNFSTATVPSTVALGTSTQCYTSASACSAAGVATYASSLSATCSDATLYPNGCSCGTAQAGAATCDPGTQYFSVIQTLPANALVSSWTTANYYAAQTVPTTTPPTGFNSGNKKETGSCPTGTYQSFFALGASTSVKSGNTTATEYKYVVQCLQTAATNYTLGYTSACYASAPSTTSDFGAQCASPYVCSYGSPTTTNASCPTGTNLFSVLGNSTVVTNTPLGTYSTDANPFNADEWSRFLYQKGIPISGCDNQKVTTYSIDVYNAQPNAQNTALMLSMARNGGGKYYNATNKQALIDALKKIFVEIQSINSTFASASLPINATNRAQNANQVFIGMFRPDPNALPRWFGNVKRYQLISDNAGNIDLGDVNGNLAINNNTGFLTACAASWWTSDSPNSPGQTTGLGYWSAYPISPDPAGACSTSGLVAYSDMPDGPQVEKGAVAEVVRKGNNPGATDTTPTFAVNRSLYTAPAAPSAVAIQSWPPAGMNSDLASWVNGLDNYSSPENSDGAGPYQTTATDLRYTRASIHGDVVHSRPLPVNYCTSSDPSTCGIVVAYYGANDGTLRAVDATTGKEKWAFVAPEFSSTALDRLRTESPAVLYPGPNPLAGATRRDYFFDGSIGIYQTANNDDVWIFPTMRRGGRMMYALDVTCERSTNNPTKCASADFSPESPRIKWRFGCPNMANDTNCVGTGAASIGQTWSLPNVGFIMYAPDISTTKVRTAVVFVGGGYDSGTGSGSCEDTDSATPSCSGPKGNIVYVLKADDGTVLASFATKRSVAADVALIDMDLDGNIDYVYATDTGGNIYRINLADYNGDGATPPITALSKDKWTITRIAYTQNQGRKFLFAPALFGSKGVVYIAVGSGDREHPLQANYPYLSYNSASPLCASSPGACAVWNRFYVYREKLPTPSPTTSSLTGGDNLDDPTLMNSSSATNPAPCGAAQTLASNFSTNKGWYIDLNNGAGEQTVTSAVISGGMVTFSTNRPIPSAAGSCSTPLGEARGYWLDLFSGSAAIETANNATCGGIASNVFVGGGLPPSPVVGTVTIGGVPQSVVIGAIQRSGQASSPISPQKATATNLPSRKRVYRVIKGED